MPLQVGDGLLVQGAASNLRMLYQERDFIILEEDPEAILRPNKARLATVIGLVTLAVAILSWLPIALVSIAGAVAYTREQFGAQLADVVPVCSDVARQRAWGAYEELLPVMLGALGEARACALLQTLHAELDSGRVQLLFQQLGRACTGLLRAGLMRLMEPGEVPGSER